MTCTFIGHRECFDVSEVLLTKEIENLIQNQYDTFLCGGMGQLDLMCARCVYKLKAKYLNVNNILVIPYLNFTIQNSEHYNEIIYPDWFEKYHFKSAILKRNQYLVSNSEAAICYIKYSWGGAAKTYALALKNKLKII